MFGISLNTEAKWMIISSKNNGYHFVKGLIGRLIISVFFTAIWTCFFTCLSPRFRHNNHSIDVLMNRFPLIY